MAKRKTAPTSRTLVTFLLDRTGSMAPITDDTIGAFNAYLEGLQQDGDLIDFTHVQFDSVSIDKLCVAVPVKDAQKLDRNTYQPRASTPLIDAAYKTIKAVETSLAGKDAKTKVVICIQTDGHENCSIEHTWADLNALIKEKSGLGWQFNFMGCGIDAYQQGRKMGISADQTVSYDRNSVAATHASFRASSSNTRGFASGQSMNTAYSAEQRRDARDAYAPADLTSVAPIAKPKTDTKPAAKKPIVDDIIL